MMAAPRVTVGIAFIDRKDLLREAVRSVFAQTFEDWELLLVDDGSTDGGLEWARSLESSRIRVLSDGLKLRYPARLNQITHAARGDYIARMDDDDLSAPDRLEKQVRFLDGRPDIDLVGTDLVSMDENENFMGKRGLPEDHAGIVRRVYSGARLAHATCLGRRDWFAANPYSEDAHLVEDYDLWLRTHQGSTFANITEPLYFYREGRSHNWAAYSRVVCSKIARLLRLARQRGRSRVAYSAVATELAKLCCCSAMCAAGMKSKFFARRHRPLTASERQKASRDLEWIRSTVLPSEREP